MKNGLMVPSLALLGLLVACDAFTGPGLRDYRDVTWFLDLPESAAGFRMESLGTFPMEAGGGGTATCTVGLQIQQGAAWGWVEEASSGEVVALKPQSSGFRSPPYPLLELWVDSSCEPPVTLPPHFNAILLADYYFEPRSGIRGLSSVGWTNAMVRSSPASASDIFRRVDLDLPGEVPVGEEMTLPVDLTLRLYLDDPETAPVFEWSDTVKLVYRRHEEVNRRSSP